MGRPAVFLFIRILCAECVGFFPNVLLLCAISRSRFLLLIMLRKISCFDSPRQVVGRICAFRREQLSFDRVFQSFLKVLNKMCI